MIKVRLIFEAESILEFDDEVFYREFGVSHIDAISYEELAKQMKRGSWAQDAEIIGTRDYTVDDVEVSE
jgi:hypothetical protein